MGKFLLQRHRRNKCHVCTKYSLSFEIFFIPACMTVCVSNFPILHHVNNDSETSRTKLWKLTDNGPARRTDETKKRTILTGTNSCHLVYKFIVKKRNNIRMA